MEIRRFDHAALLVKDVELQAHMLQSPAGHALAVMVFCRCTSVIPMAIS